MSVLQFNPTIDEDGGLSRSKDSGQHITSWWVGPAANGEEQSWRDAHREALDLLGDSDIRMGSALLINLGRDLVRMDRADGAGRAAIVSSKDRRSVLQHLGRLFAGRGILAGAYDGAESHMPIPYLAAVLFRYWVRGCCGDFVLASARRRRTQQTDKVEHDPTDSISDWGKDLARRAWLSGYTDSGGRLRPWPDLRGDLGHFLDGWNEPSRLGGGQEKGPHLSDQRQHTSVGMSSMALRSMASERNGWVPWGLAQQLWNLEGSLGAGPNQLPADLVRIQRAAWDRYILERSGTSLDGDGGQENRKNSGFEKTTIERGGTGRLM